MIVYRYAVQRRVPRSRYRAARPRYTTALLPPVARALRMATDRVPAGACHTRVTARPPTVAWTPRTFGARGRATRWGACSRRAAATPPRRACAAPRRPECCPRAEGFVGCGRDGRVVVAIGPAASVGCGALALLAPIRPPKNAPRTKPTPSASVGARRVRRGSGCETGAAGAATGRGGADRTRGRGARASGGSGSNLRACSASSGSTRASSGLTGPRAMPISVASGSARRRSDVSALCAQKVQGGGCNGRRVV